MRKLNAFVLLAVIGVLSGCASAGPAVKVICGICEGVCPAVTPLLGAKKKALPKCEDGKILRVVNFKDVEKDGAEPRVECRK